jgi:hypothetical protein
MYRSLPVLYVGAEGKSDHVLQRVSPGADMILKGEDAKRFLEQMNAAVMTPERLLWLKETARQSIAAEERGKRLK